MNEHENRQCLPFVCDFRFLNSRRTDLERFPANPFAKSAPSNLRFISMAESPYSPTGVEAEPQDSNGMSVGSVFREILKYLGAYLLDWCSVSAFAFTAYIARCDRISTALVSARPFHAGRLTHQNARSTSFSDHSAAVEGSNRATRVSLQPASVTPADAGKRGEELSAKTLPTLPLDSNIVILAVLLNNRGPGQPGQRRSRPSWLEADGR